MDETTRLALEALHRVHNSDELSALEIDDEGVLRGDGAVYIPSVRRQKLATPGAEGVRHVEAVVWHYTDTRNAGAVNLATRIRDAAPAGQERSCHVWIDRAGKIAQSVPFEAGSWHAGSPTAALFTRGPDGGWKMLTAAQRGKMRGWGANSFAAGIELENVGHVRRVGDKWLGWPFAFNTPHGAPVVVPADEVDTDRGLHTFTERQVGAAIRVVAALAHRYGLTRDAFTLTHHAIDPTRREDPGDLWIRVHLPKILDAVF